MYVYSGQTTSYLAIFDLLRIFITYCIVFVKLSHAILCRPHPICYSLIIWYFGFQPCCFLDVKKTQSNAISIYGVKIVYARKCSGLCVLLYAEGCSDPRWLQDKQAETSNDIEWGKGDVAASNPMNIKISFFICRI